MVFGCGYEAEIGFEAYCGFAYGVAVVVVEDDEFGSGERVLCVTVAVAKWDGGALSNVKLNAGYAREIPDTL